MTMQSTLTGKKLRSGLIFKKKIKSLFKRMLISIKKAVVLKSLKRQSSNTLKQFAGKLPSLSVFDHFEVLALKRLIMHMIALEAFLKCFQYSQENTCLSNFLKKRLQHRCFPVNIAKS